MNRELGRYRVLKGLRKTTKFICEGSRIAGSHLLQFLVLSAN
jgi:hypothetical protein